MSQLRHTVTTLRISKVASNDSGGELTSYTSSHPTGKVVFGVPTAPLACDRAAACSSSTPVTIM